MYNNGNDGNRALCPATTLMGNVHRNTPCYNNSARYGRDS